jgi:hypothetical protein
VRPVNTDLIAGLLALAVTIVFWQAREAWTPLSATWPNAILTFMFICSLALLAKAFIGPEKSPLFAEGDRRRMVVAALALVAWGLGIRYIGFVTSSVVVFAFLWWYMSRAVAQTDDEAEPPSGVLDYARALGMILVIVGLFYTVFTRYLHVPLPRGLLF